MNAKNLQKATVILSEIQSLDKQVIELEKLGQSIMEEKGLYDFTINYNKPKKEEYNNSDEDSLNGLYRFAFSFGGGLTTPKEETEKVSLQADETEILFVISTLLNIKRDKRKTLVSNIFKLGVSL